MSLAVGLAPGFEDVEDRLVGEGVPGGHGGIEGGEQVERRDLTVLGEETVET
jgi:hypothetical protein